MSEQIVWTQEVHLFCPREQVEVLAHAYVEEFKGRQDVQVVRWGRTNKQQQGVIILEWDGEVPWPFLDRLEQSQAIEDFYLQGVCYDLIPPETIESSRRQVALPPCGETGRHNSEEKGGW
jgi:hypothetical protein